jgi:hypothetical protein
MEPEINTVGQAVYSCSWADSWSWQAHTPETLMQGTAASEDEAWRMARQAATMLNETPKGQG